MAKENRKARQKRKANIHGNHEEHENDGIHAYKNKNVKDVDPTQTGVNLRGP